MFYRCNYAVSGDGLEMGSKRQRLVDQGSSYYGTTPGSSFMYNTSPYAYATQPPLPFPVVRLCGLPFDCSEVEVAEFFHGLDVVDILYVHRNGRFMVEAYCVLGFVLQVDFALQRNRQNMGKRHVEVFRCKTQDYYEAIVNEVSDVRGGAKSNDENKD